MSGARSFTLMDFINHSLLSVISFENPENVLQEVMIGVGVQWSIQSKYSIIDHLHPM